MIENMQQLGLFLKSKAGEFGVRVMFDTHYDAANWELSWWQGSVLHRLDFQPQESTRVSITQYEDSFQCLPKFLRWAHGTIPLFPYLAQIKWINIATEYFPIDESSIETIIAEAIKE